MKNILITSGLLFAAQVLCAAELPSAGTQLQQIPASQPSDPAAPQLDFEAPDVAIAAPTDGARFLVKQLRVVNTRVFTEQQLLAATAFQPGSELTLGQLRGFAARISNYYRAAGYFLAQAVVPPQDVVDGVVAITVTEGRYGKIELRNTSGLSASLAQGLLGGLDSGAPVAIRPLETRLLRLADLPGLAVKSTLAPGATRGTSDLIVEVSPGQRVTGSVDADNSGSRYTGENRFGGTINFNNLAGRGDVLTLRALTSLEGLNYGRAGYQMQFGRAAAGVAFTALDYELGREFESLKAQGTAQIASVYGSYPLLRQRASNLNATLNFDSKSFEDIIAVTNPDTTTEKRTRAATLGLAGDQHDSFGGGGLSAYSLSFTAGDLTIDSADAAAVDALTARSDGHYSKFSLGLQRLQRVTNSLTLYATLHGQFAPQNLDVSEKLALGGAAGVRAYPEGEAYVDQGYLLTLEARVTLPQFSALPGQLQWVAFADTARGDRNRDPWSSERNRQTLSGGGLGVSWFEPRGFELKAYYAHTLGSTADTSTPDGDSRVWFNASKSF